MITLRRFLHSIPARCLTAITLLVATCCVGIVGTPSPAAELERLPYNHPGLVVNLGVGLYAFPLPMDWDSDGDLDLLVACPDRHANGVYLFENPGPPGEKLPVFKAAVRLGPGAEYMTLSTVAGKPRLLAAGREYPNFTQGDTKTVRPIHGEDRLAPIKKMRGNTWRLVDYDGDGASDLVVGHDSWDAFGWFDNNRWAQSYNAQGQWTAALPQGWMYWARNLGSDAAPRFGPAEQFIAGGRPMETVGAPTPNLADFDGDGDLDLISGEFLDGFTYYQNVGDRKHPRYAAAVRLTSDGRPLVMDLQMIVPHAIDWDADGDVDMICGDEDGRVAFIEQRGVATGLPNFALPRYFQQQADTVKCGALATPAACDWDGDGDEDLISGNTAGYLEFIENLSGPKVSPPRWAAPVRLNADDKLIRIQAGPSGSIQGPIEAKWGYTVPSVADWDGDGLLDVMINSIWGRIEWYRNIGTRTSGKLAAAQSVEVEWPGAAPKPAWNWWSPKPRELVTQWRTTPVMVDWNADGMMDLVMLDHDGWVCLWRREKRDGKLVLLPGERALCDKDGQPMRFNEQAAGRSGRRKLAVVDWDGDGKLDILADDKNAALYRQLGQRDGKFLFENLGDLAAGDTSSHSPGVTTVDWDGDGVRDLLIGAQEGRFYFLKNPRSK